MQIKYVNIAPAPTLVRNSEARKYLNPERKEERHLLA